MALQILLLIAGLILVLIGAEGLVDGSSNIARKWGVSEFIIGLTIVAFGTSAPEMVVSFISSIEGRSDMAVGNIIGSNIFNTAFILGLSALICPIFVTKSNLRKDIPLNIISAALLIILGINGTLFGIGENVLSRADGAILLVLFFAYVIYSIKKDKQNDEEESEEEGKPKKLWISIVYTVGGLACLILGGELFVDNAEAIAHEVGLSDKFIGITILALGTSLPELATGLVAAFKGKSQMVLGDILGSNIFNILLILGGASLINPLAMHGITWVDFAVVLLCSVVVLAGALLSKKKQLRFGTGTTLILVGVAYMTYLFINL